MTCYKGHTQGSWSSKEVHITKLSRTEGSCSLSGGLSWVPCNSDGNYGLLELKIKQILLRCVFVFLVLF